MGMFKALFGTYSEREVKRIKPLVDKIENLESTMEKLSDEELKGKTEEFKERYKNGETLDDLLVEAFAVVREASWRVLKMKHYREQLIGGIVLHQGRIAEMKTGEGKTLTCTMPAYLNALTGEGVHIVTVNEYLVGVAADWMGKVYNFLGLTVGKNYRDSSIEEKKEAYNSDIMYSTNNEIGFDYLRDNMVIRASDRVMRPFNFVIVDEVDSILIDEARTPLIISGGSMHSANLYKQADSFAKKLHENDGYVYDEKLKVVTLDDKGVNEAEKYFRVNNLYDINNSTLVHFINQALRANFAMKKDFDYVVENGEVIIVDPFTGRLMKGRNYSDGLHQAIEAKEGVQIQEETKTLATITFQNLFRMYKKISGMTGTAKTEEEEFRDIYNMYVIQIPTNKPVIREDFGDLLFATKKGKYKAIVNEIKERHAKGQPVLVGTIAVETSELLSDMLKKEHIPHEVLNAKNHAREAEIIAKAGEKGAVTIATNMAGRGTDIKLTDEVKALGGLAVIGTERHESRRIDNQLRGRSGRQGDPGFSQFCVSFEDDLLVRFGTDRAKMILQRVGFTDDMSIRNKMLSSSVETAQKRIEGNNYDMRKTILQYDDVINKQREAIYAMRNEILDTDDIHSVVVESIKNYVSALVEDHLAPEGYLTLNDITEIIEAINQVVKNDVKVEDLDDQTVESVTNVLTEKVLSEYEEKLSSIPSEIVSEFERAISLRVMDTHWMEHINTMSILKEGIHLRGYAQENPLRAYTTEGYELFEDLLDTIDKETTMFLLKAEVRQNAERKEVAKGKAADDESKVAKKTPKKSTKVGRNDPCPCGSGKKYKQCCGK